MVLRWKIDPLCSHFDVTDLGAWHRRWTWARSPGPSAPGPVDVGRSASLTHSRISGKYIQPNSLQCSAKIRIHVHTRRLFSRSRVGLCMVRSKWQAWRCLEGAQQSNRSKEWPLNKGCIVLTSTSMRGYRLKDWPPSTVTGKHRWHCTYVTAQQLTFKQVPTWESDRQRELPLNRSSTVLMSTPMGAHCPVVWLKRSEHPIEWPFNRVIVKQGLYCTWVHAYDRWLPMRVTVKQKSDCAYVQAYEARLVFVLDADPTALERIGDHAALQVVTRIVHRLHQHHVIVCERTRRVYLQEASATKLRWC